MSKFIKIIPIAFLVIAVAVLIAYFNQPSPQASPGPTINWTPTKITETISPGESKSVGASFVSHKDLNNIEVSVVPELRLYVEVNPNRFAHVSAGVSIPLSIEFSAPSDAELGTFEGTIHIKNKKTYSKPLPVILNIWQKVVSEGIYEIKIPPSWQVIGDTQNRGLLSPQTKTDLDLGAVETPEDISVAVFENPDFLPVSQFASQYQNGWFESYQVQENLIVDGRNAIRYSDIGASIGHAPLTAVFIDATDKVIVITLNLYESDEAINLLEIFNQVVATFEID